MGKSYSQKAYAQAVGTSPTGSAWIDVRDPTSNDVNYPIGQFWINTAAVKLWYLNSQTNQVTASNPNGFLQSVWELISVESLLASISDTANTPVFPSSSSDTPPDNIQLLAGSGISIVSDPANHRLTITNTATASNFAPDTGTSPVSGSTVNFSNTSILATGTLANAIRSNGTAANTIAYQLQYAGSNAGSSAASKWGVAQFDSTQFNVSSGFVQLAGGTTAPLLELTTDAHTAPGTSPVLPNGSGNITLEGGSTFSTGTQANPIRTNSLAANTIDLQIQLAGANAATSTPNNFGVAQFDSNSFGVSAGFVTLKNGGTTGAITNIIGDDSQTVVPSSGAITLDGVTVANATNSKPVYFKKNATSIEELDVQLATTSTSAAKNINKSGLSHFDSTYFTIDSATGFVSLVSVPDTGLIPDAHTAPGTSPVLPNSSGNIILEGGATFATGTQANPIRTNSLAANTIDFQIQLAGSNAGSSTANNFGVAQFDSNQFGVSNGFVQLKGGGTAPALTKMAVDAGTNPVVPDSTGQITVTAAQVANGVVGANVIRSNGTGANTCTLQIQRSTVSAASDLTKNGVCHFNSSQFSVDSSGFVSFTGSPGIFPWTDEAVSFNASSNNGYFVTATATATLPASPNQGDVVKFACTSSGILTITANAGQTIRIGNVVSSTAGTAASTRQGDSIELVFRSSDKVWYSSTNPVGTWGLA